MIKKRIRVAAILPMSDGFAFMHRTEVKNHPIGDYYTFPGGGLEENETLEEGVKREIQEEIGKKVEITGYISTIENFFGMNDTKYHEILFVHKAECVDDEDKKIEETLKNIEGREELHYEWVDLDKIDGVKEIIAESINAFIASLVDLVSKGISGSLSQADVSNLKGNLE